MRTIAPSTVKMRRTLGIFAIALLAIAGGVSTSEAAPRSDEYIICSGGPSLIEWEKLRANPHDRYWGNFIRTARIRMQQIRGAEGGNDVNITWLVYRRA